jgi:urease accessory protein
MDTPTEHDGWVASLDLAYARAGSRTVPTLRAHSGPLRVQKHFEPEPGLCEHILVHPPGGIAGGDDLSIRVSVGEQSKVRLTTPGATRWYRGAGRAASQRVEVTVARGATFELLPHPHLVFDEARATSSLVIDLAADTTFIGWDIVALGRPAGDHPFVSGRWCSRLELTREGRLDYSDRLDLPADSPLRRSPLGLSGHDAFGTALFVGTGTLDLTSVDPLGLSVGLTELGSGLRVARALGGSAEVIHQWFIALWRLALPSLTGRQATPPRIWRT